MQANYLLFGVLLGGLLGLALGRFGLDQIIDAMYRHASAVMLVLIAFALAIGLLYIGLRRLVSSVLAPRKDGDTAKPHAVIGQAVALIAASHSEEARDKLTALGSAVIESLAVWRVRVALINALWGVAVVLGGVAGTFVLMRQNELVQVQNTFFNRQVVLQGAERFSGYAPLVNQLLADINLEAVQQRALRQTQLQEDFEAYSARTGHNKEQNNDHIEALLGPLEISEGLLARINSILIQLEPYPFLETSQEIATSQDISKSRVLYLSPERGQILQALTQGPFDLWQLMGADFSFADMRDRTIEDDDFHNYLLHSPGGCEHPIKHALTALDLSFADFSGAHLTQAEFAVQEGMRVDRMKFEASKVTIGGAHRPDLSSIEFYDTKLVNEAALLDHNRADEAVSLTGVTVTYDVQELTEGCISLFRNTDIQTAGAGSPFAIDGLTMVFGLLESPSAEASEADILPHLYALALSQPETPLPTDVLLNLFSFDDLANPAGSDPIGVFSVPVDQARAYASIVRDADDGQAIHVVFEHTTGTEVD